MGKDTPSLCTQLLLTLRSNSVHSPLLLPPPSLKMYQTKVLLSTSTTHSSSGPLTSSSPPHAPDATAYLLTNASSAPEPSTFEQPTALCTSNTRGVRGSPSLSTSGFSSHAVQCPVSTAPSPLSASIEFAGAIKTCPDTPTSRFCPHTPEAAAYFSIAPRLTSEKHTCVQSTVTAPPVPAYQYLLPSHSVHSPQPLPDNQHSSFPCCPGTFSSSSCPHSPKTVPSTS